jgi:hypothetical protein
MAKSQPTPAAAVLVAVDVAKLRKEVLIEVPEARRRRRMTVTNTRAEHDRLVAELHALERPVTVGLEPTGHYHRPLAWRLAQAGFSVRLISSVALARTREALHPLGIHPPAINAQHRRDPSVAVAAAFGRRGYDRLGQRRLILPDAAHAALRRARLAKGATRPAFRDAERGPHMTDTGAALRA